MACFSLLDTSQLDLNANPMSLTDEVPIKEVQVQTNFLELGRKGAVKKEVSALEEELNRVNEENKKLTEKLTVLCENYNNLRSHLMDYMSKNPVGGDQAHMVGKKRKAESSITTNNGGKKNHHGGDITTFNSDQSSSSDEDSSCNKKPAGVREEEHVKVKTSRVCVRTEASDASLVVKDGYQWRKYGQKVTRDNPSPRAYFKCSFAPICPVKKKVQRSIEDQSILVATYEGEHNHSRVEAASSSNLCVTIGTTPPCPPSLASSGQTITLDLTKPKANTDAKTLNPAVSNSQEFQQFLVEQMASSLTKDPSFKAAVAAAISGRFLQHNKTEKW